MLARSTSSESSDHAVDMTIHSTSRPSQSPVGDGSIEELDGAGASLADGRRSRPRYHRRTALARRTAMIDSSIEAALATNGTAAKAGAQPDPQETREWLDALDGVIEAEGAGRASELVRALVERAATRGVRTPAA